MIVDSHCHLNYYPSHEVESIIGNARDNGVLILQNICTNMEEADQIVLSTEKFDCVFGSVGVHPGNVEHNNIITYEKLLEYTHHSKIIGIGETGLDLYKYANSLDDQKMSFLTHIHVAKDTGLPIIIHNRNSDAEMIEILKSEMNSQNLTGVVHCFSSSMELAKVALNLGLYISFAGIVTFKGAHNVHEVAKYVPLDRILVETDSPFLSPTPHRAKRNEPAMIRFIVEYIATLHKIPSEVIARKTTDNFFRLFSKTKPISHDENE